MFALVKDLSEIPGPVGHEDPVQDWVARDWARFSQSVRRTRVDNVLARVGGSGKKLVFVSILRAGTGILDGMLSVVPGARVGHIGLYRDPKTLTAVEYYFKVPSHMEDRDVVVVDPMLATGNSAIAAIERVKETRPKSIKFVCLLTCPEGIKALQAAHPDVPIFTAAIDRELNDHGYILPGLGDAGDRIFGTK